MNLPESYQDDTGLPFRREDLNQREINVIFGPHLEAERGNRLLRIIHGRRVAGTLDDPNLSVNTDAFSDADRAKALEYLRANIPVDEIVNAGLRAEDELRYLEEQEQQEQQEREKEAIDQPVEESSPERPAPQSPAQPPAVVEKVNVPIGQLPKKPKSDSPYGESLFDKIRARNTARREAEEKKAEEERLKREEEDAKNNIGTLQTQVNKPRELSPFMQKWAAHATSDLKEPPPLKPWERLLPSVAMTVLVLAGCAIFAVMYTPPRLSQRAWPDIPPAAATCLTLIGLNLSVYFLWKVPMLWKFLNRYFIVVAATPRPFQLVGAIFSHQKFSHAIMNMVGFWFFGTRLHDDIGRGNFLAIYFSSGVLGFMTSLSYLVFTKALDCTTLGASGAIYGVAAAFFWLHKYDEFKLFGYPPDPLSGPQGLAFIGLMLGLHIFPLFSKRARSVDIPSHLGGLVAGVIGADLVKRHMDEKARVRAEKLKTMGVLEKTIQVKDAEKAL